MLLGFTLALGLWNAHTFPPGKGYDAAADIAYADGLFPGFDLPAHTGEFHNPPLFYLLAGIVDWVGHSVGAGQPHDATQLLDVLFFVGTIFFVWRTARLLWPARERLALAAATFTALLPAAVRAAVMFHPEALDMFLATLAMYLCVRVSRSPYSTRLALLLGATLGAAQLVRTSALLVVAAVFAALLLAGHRRALVIAAVLAVVIPAPWYARQWIVYGTPLPFNRPAPTTPLYARRPLSFYIDPGLPDLFTHPYRPHFVNEFIPTTYAELWGDYFGIWNWDARRAPSTLAKVQLSLQSALGVIPTILAIVGCAALVARIRRRRDLAIVGLLPLFGLAGYLAFTVSYPSVDGDVLKATYLLGTTVGWASGFAYALASLPHRTRAPVLTLLAIVVLADLSYLIYH